MMNGNFTLKIPLRRKAYLRKRSSLRCKGAFVHGSKSLPIISANSSTESHPLLNVQLPDGSRLAALLPTVVRPRPALTIRKFAKVRYTLADLIGGLKQWKHTSYRYS